MRYEEDYRYLADPARRAEALDRLKYILLAGAAHPDSYLSLGGETRQLFEYFQHAAWSPAPGNGYYLPRYFLAADLHLGPHLRLYGQLASALAAGREGGPRPIDEDKLFVHQAFAELALGDTARVLLRVRAGRQEIALGTGRLLTVRLFPNVPLSHDVLRVIVSRGAEWRATAFVLRPVENRRGVFDNPSFYNQQTLWGLYGNFPLAFLPDGKLDVYYLGLERRQATFNRGAGYELRHTVGTRWAGQRAAWDYNLEAIYQWGGFRASTIRAWTASANVGYTLAGPRAKLRFGLKADVISGDQNPESGPLRTFNPLFPNPQYLSQTGLLGPANLVDLHPSLKLALAPTLNLTADGLFLWRQSLRDGLYAPDGRPVRLAGTTRTRYVGELVEGGPAWQVGRHVQATVIYTHFFAGPYLRDSPPVPGRDVDFVDAFVTVTF